MFFDVPWIEAGPGDTGAPVAGRELESLVRRALKDDTDSGDSDSARSADDEELGEIEEEGDGRSSPTQAPPKRHRAERPPVLVQRSLDVSSSDESGSSDDAPAEALLNEEEQGTNKYAYLLHVALRGKAAGERRFRAQQREAERLRQLNHELSTQVVLAKAEATKVGKRVRRVMNCVSSYVSAQQAAVMRHATTAVRPPPSQPAEPQTAPPTQSGGRPAVSTVPDKAPTRARGRPRKADKCHNPTGRNQHPPALPSLGFTLRDIPPPPGAPMEQWEREFLKRGRDLNGWHPQQVAAVLKRSETTIKTHWWDELNDA